MAQMAEGRRVNKKQLAQLLGTTPYEVDQWIAYGCPVLKAGSLQGAPWEFDTAAVSRWLRAGGPDASAVGNLELEKERARLAREQADGWALKNEKMRSELIPADEAAEVWAKACAHADEVLMAIPAACAHEVIAAANSGGAPAVAEVLQHHVHTALEDLASTTFENEEEAAA